MLEWLFFTLLAPLLGFLYYISLAYRFDSHVSGFTGHLRFYLAPRGPQLMIVVKHLDNNVSVIYDPLVLESSRGVVVEDRGVLYLLRRDPRHAPLVALADARAPVGHPSPFGLAVRALTGWMVALMAGWIGFVNGFLGPLLEGQSLSAVNWLVFTAFITQLYYVLGVVLERIYRPQTRLASYVEAGYSPPYHVLAPSCSPFDDTPLESCLRELGARLVIEVPDSLADLVKGLVEKGGSAALTAKLINTLEDNVTLRKTIAELKKRMIRETEAAKSLLAAQAWKMATRITLSKALLLVAVLVVGLVVGYSLGSQWAISLQPFNATQSPPPTPAQPPPPPMPSPAPNATVVTPAPPPPPPSPAGNTTVTPAPAPPPG